MVGYIRDPAGYVIDLVLERDNEGSYVVIGTPAAPPEELLIPVVDDDLIEIQRLKMRIAELEAELRK